jgi:Na+/H+ antiporter NhaD/arsenite permease-like protein
MVLKEYDAWIFVKNKRNFYKSLIILVISIILFIFLPLITPITIDIIAISGGVLLIFLTANDELTSLMKKMDFELVFYLIGVFFVVDALSFTGALNFVSQWLIFVSQGNLLIGSLIILWLSSGLSSLMNNTPVTKIMIPAIDKLATRFAINPNVIFTSLAYGTNLRDNLTPWGDNLVAMKISSNYKRPINFWKFFKIGVLASVIQLFATTIYLVIIINTQFALMGVSILLAISFTIILIYFHKGIYKIVKKFINNILKKIG